VDEHEVGVGLEPLRVRPDPLEVGRLEGVRPRHRHPLKRVVHQLRHREELLRALEQLPVRVDAHVLEQGDLGIQQLRHAAPEAGAAHLDQAAPLEGGGGLPEPLHGLLAGGFSEVLEPPLVGDGNAAEHERQSNEPRWVQGRRRRL
jgi:hypothetical protein